MEQDLEQYWMCPTLKQLLMVRNKSFAKNRDNYLAGLRSLCSPWSIWLVSIGLS